jgi:uncharacterized protein YndB with AHSA1/START domain
MEQQRTSITVAATINAPIEKVWAAWNDPEAITQWCTATPEWHTPRATQDLRVGGSFTTRMEAKDGSMGFDFGGVYDTVEEHRLIEYTMGDGRRVSISFDSDGDTTQVSETFDAENQNPVEMQRAGWQAIMDNFKSYVESR